MKAVPKVSVVTPAYNASRYVRETIESVKRQRYTHWEHIIVDDGSTDETREICEGLCDGRTTLIAQDNAGVSAARNLGFRRSKGEYLVFLDSDDTLEPDMLTRMVEVLDQDSSASAVVCNLNYIDKKGHRIHVLPTPRLFSESREELVRQDDLRSFLLGHSFPPCTVLLRGSDLPNDPFDPDLNGTEDSYLWTELASNGRGFNFIEERLVNYRRHPQSATHDRLKMKANRAALVVKSFELSGVKAVPVSQLRAVADAIHEIMGTASASPRESLAKMSALNVNALLAGCSELERRLFALNCVRTLGTRKILCELGVSPGVANRVHALQVLRALVNEPKSLPAGYVAREILRTPASFAAVGMGIVAHKVKTALGATIRFSASRNSHRIGA